MSENSIGLEKIKKLLPHREPMLLIKELRNIVSLKSATGTVEVKKESFLTSTIPVADFRDTIFLSSLIKSIGSRCGNNFFIFSRPIEFSDIMPQVFL
jgi:hypothetical protein